MVRSPAVILALLTGLNLLNYLDRFVVSAVLPKVQEDLALSNFEAGLLAAIFLVSYFVASPLFGTLADRGKRTPLLALGVFLWSLATVASGLAGTKAALFAARAFVGVGEASYATIVPTLIDDIAPKEKKGRWLAIFYAATPIGSALGYLAGGAAAHAHGWRAAFYITGGPGLVLALTCLAIAEPPRVLTAVKATMVDALRQLWPIGMFRRAVFGYCAQTAAIGAFAFWAPKFLYSTHGLTLDRANFLFGATTVVAGAIGTGVGGALGDRRSRRMPGQEVRAYLNVSALGSAVAAPAALLAFLARTPLEFFVAVFVCELALFLSTSPINAAILRAVPESARASAMALTIFAIHLLGDLWSPAAIGYLADRMPMKLAMMFLPIAIAASAGLWWSKPTTPAPAT